MIDLLLAYIDPPERDVLIQFLGNFQEQVRHALTHIDRSFEHHLLLNRPINHLLVSLEVKFVSDRAGGMNKDHVDRLEDVQPLQ